MSAGRTQSLIARRRFSSKRFGSPAAPVGRAVRFSGIQGQPERGPHCGPSRRSARKAFWPVRFEAGSASRPGLAIPPAQHPAVRATPCREFSMAKQVLIDASHPEETRVVVVRGQRVEEFDFEAANRKQLRKGKTIYSTRRSPPAWSHRSRQPFIELLAATATASSPSARFTPTPPPPPNNRAYYQIPTADRQALLGG